MERIDVLLAVFNGEKFIKEQIESILDQTYKPLHLIIRDNCSDDSTATIVKKFCVKFPDRITFISSPKNQGVIGNFAALMEETKSNYVMFSDADDQWNKDKVQKTFEKMRELENLYGKTKPLLVHTDLTVVDKNLSAIHPSFWQYSNICPKIGNSLTKQLVQNTITGCTTLINRSLLDLALPILDDVIVMHDWWLGLIASAFGKIDFVNEPTMLYRQHGKNDTGAKRYGFFSYFKRFTNPNERKKIQLNKQKRFLQAKILLKLYENLLDTKQKELLNAFIRMENAPFFEKRALMIKHRLYKQGLLRNILEFILN